MRCINCGWNNPDHLRFCQKCNQPMPVFPADEKAVETKADKTDSKKTIREPEPVVKPEPVVAPEPVVVPEPEPVVVPEPAPVPEPVPEPAPEPVPEAAPAAMKLVPLEPGEAIVCETLPCVVNRNSSPDFGPAVDAVCQSEITCTEEGCFIEDKSACKNTYVLASRKIRVEKGDIVVMGGRRFVIE